MRIKISDKDEQVLFNETLGKGTVCFTLWDTNVFRIVVKGHHIYFEALNTDEGCVTRQYRFFQVGMKSWRKHVKD